VTEMAKKEINGQEVLDKINALAQKYDTEY
jgi:hypothetical protein